MVARTRFDLLIIEPKAFCASHASLQVARGIIEVDPDQLFYVLVTNVSEKQVFIPKHRTIAHTVDRGQLDTPTEGTILESQPDTVSAVHYKPSVDRDNQMSNRRAG